MAKKRKGVLTEQPKQPAAVEGWKWGGNNETKEIVKYLWEPWIPYSCLSLICGNPQLGKSTLMAFLAARVTKLGASSSRTTGEIPAGAVVWIHGEESWGVATRPRLLAAGADVQRVIRPQPKQAGERLTIWQLSEQLPALVNHGVRLVIVDPLASLADEGSDWKSEGSARQCLDRLQALAAELQIAVVGTRNWNKSRGVSRLDRICGSAAFRDVPRSILSVIPDPLVRGRYVLCHDKHSLSDGARALCYSLDSNPGTPPVWKDRGPCAIEADSLDGDRVVGSDRAEWEAAHELIRSLIGDGDVPAATVYTQAAALGIGKRCIWRASVELRVRRSRVGFGPGSHVNWLVPKDGWPETVGQEGEWEEGDNP